MGDPLSAIAGVIGLADVAARTSSLVWRLVVQWRDAPAQLLLLQEDLRNFSHVAGLLQVVCETTKERSGSQKYALLEPLSTQAEIATRTWLELQAIVESISAAPEIGRSRIRRERWLAKRSRVAVLYLAYWWQTRAHNLLNSMIDEKNDRLYIELEVGNGAIYMHLQASK